MAFRIIVDGRRAVLPGAGPAPRQLSGAAAALQGLHLGSQAQRLPLAAHRRDRTRSASASRSRSAPSEMQDQAERGVAAHWIYKQGGPSTDAPQYAWLRSLHRHPRQGAERRGIPRAHQARDVPGPGVLLHAQGQADRAAARRDADRLRLCRAQPGRRHLRRRQDQRPHAAAAHAARERRPGRHHHRRRRRRRRRPGSASSSPARPRPRSAASSARASASSTSSSASRCSTRPSTRKATRSRKRASTACASTSSRRRRTTSSPTVGAGLVGAREVLTAVYPGLKQRGPAREAAPTSCRSRVRAPSPAKAAEGGAGGKRRPARSPSAA